MLLVAIVMVLMVMIGLVPIKMTTPTRQSCGFGKETVGNRRSPLSRSFGVTQLAGLVLRVSLQ